MKFINKLSLLLVLGAISFVAAEESVDASPEKAIVGGGKDNAANEQYSTPPKQAKPFNATEQLEETKELARRNLLDAKGQVSFDKLKAKEEANIQKFVGIIEETKAQLENDNDLSEEEKGYLMRRIAGLQKHVDERQQMSEEEYEMYLVNSVKNFYTPRSLKISNEL